MIDVNHLHKVYAEKDGLQTVALKDVSLHIERGEVVSIIGPSGAGKSVFLRMLNLLERPTSGSIMVAGEEILEKDYPLHRLRQRMGMVFQNFNLFKHLTVKENVTLAPMKVLGLSREEAEKEAMETLRKVAMADKANALPTDLSGGQQQRAAIARCLAMKPDIILFDEPTSALDPTMVGEVQGVIRQLAQEKMTMLIVTHVLQFAREVSTRTVFMENGSIVEDAPSDTLFSNPRETSTRAFVHRIRSLVFDIRNIDFDFYDMTSQIKQFCIKHNLADKMNPVTHVVEEMLLILSNYTSPVHIEVNYSEMTQDTSVAVLHIGETLPPLDRADTDELSAMIVKGMSKSITVEPTTEGIKTIIEL